MAGTNVVAVGAGDGGHFHSVGDVTLDAAAGGGGTRNDGEEFSIAEMAVETREMPLLSDDTVFTALFFGIAKKAMKESG